MSSRAARWVSLLVAVTAQALLVACGPQPPVPEIDLAAALPPVAAQYRTVVSRDDGEYESTWRVWREPDRFITENLTEQTAAHWQRDGRALFHRKLFHADRRGIEFQIDDLRLLGALPDWTTQTLLFDPQLLAALPAVASGWRDGRPFRRHAGEINGVIWSVTVAVDLMLPFEIERRTGTSRERTSLQEAFPLDSAPWQPQPCDDYEIIDFTDLGDRQADPFVLKVESQWGLGHAH